MSEDSRMFLHRYYSKALRRVVSAYFWIGVSTQTQSSCYRIEADDRSESDDEPKPHQFVVVGRNATTSSVSLSRESEKERGVIYWTVQPPLTPPSWAV